MKKLVVYGSVLFLLSFTTACTKSVPKVVETEVMSKSQMNSYDQEMSTDNGPRADAN